MFHRPVFEDDPFLRHAACQCVAPLLAAEAATEAFLALVRGTPGGKGGIGGDIEALGR
jgi:hypothetical protein